MKTTLILVLVFLLGWGLVKVLERIYHSRTRAFRYKAKSGLTRASPQHKAFLKACFFIFFCVLLVAFMMSSPRNWMDRTIERTVDYIEERR